MKTLLLIAVSFFWLLLIYYSALTVAGVWHRLTFRKPEPLDEYPSVALLIPAHNERIVIERTLRAMARLKYPGKLDIYLLDDQSTDGTGEIAKSFAHAFSHIHYIRVPPGGPKGKSRVLNYGLSISESDYFIVYDADNEPEADALQQLVEAAERTPNAAGAVGFVKTKNFARNWLTRMIGLEFQVFHLLMQCGRWALFQLGSLPGTNMLLKRKVLEDVGGYDVYALAEDAELTIRITAAGYRLPVVPTARTWEQEPENVKTFVKQRTRWLIGNIYLLEKSFQEFRFWRGRTFVLSLQHVLTYLVFILLLLFSDIVFILSLTGYELPPFDYPLLILWFMSYVVYTSQLLSAIVVEQEVSFVNVLFMLIMYFTYAQLFIILLLRSFAIYFWNKLRKQTIGWDKTVRFESRED